MSKECIHFFGPLCIHIHLVTHVTGLELQLVFPPNRGVERLQLLFVSEPCRSSEWQVRAVVPSDIQIFTLGQGWQLCNKIYYMQIVVI
jgi:hypothetical protein